MSRLPHMLFLSVLIMGCSNEVEEVAPPAKTSIASANKAESPLELGFIAFGDSGYHTDYLKEKQFTPLKPTRQDFIDFEYAEWIKKGHKPEDFVPPPSEFVEAVGSMVDASGLYPVADAMKSFCLKEECEFSVMLGDNIYPDGATVGADGKDDTTRFDDIFTKPLGGLGQGNPDYRIYTALGNHDWDTSREGAMAQVEFMQTNKPFYMDGIFYTVKPPAAMGDIEIFVIDTDVMLAGETVLDAELNPDGSEATDLEVDKPDPWKVPQNSDERNMASWLEEKLKNSTAKWKFVIGHHPIWSSGGSKFEQAKVIRRMIMPAMCQYADIYFAGHEHSLELHEDSCEAEIGKGKNKPLLQVLSGAAAKQRPVHKAFKAYQDATYPQNKAIFVQGMTWGFSHIQLSGDMATIRMLTTPNDGSGKVNLEYTYQYPRRTGN
ncbi:MAG: metallophosphoesterase [Paraglaciecola sp.]|uniref:metallophosphoesterase n=1 Tax=Paraglaciecola sp. TaxID=1920173 RepID=UPI00329939CD